MAKVDEGYIDDDTYQPYRFLTDWYLTEADSLMKVRIPLPKSASAMKGKKYVLYGKLNPQQEQQDVDSESNKDAKPIDIQIDDSVAWAIDRSASLRGIWMQTPIGWYWLQQPSKKQYAYTIKLKGLEEEQEEAELVATFPSMESIHLESRALFGLISNLSDIFILPELKYAKAHSKRKVDEIYELLKTDDDEPFDIALLRQNPSYVKTHMVDLLPVIDKSCKFIKSLNFKSKGPKYTQEMLLASAKESERRSCQTPWGGILDGEEKPNLNQLLDDKEEDEEEEEVEEDDKEDEEEEDEEEEYDNKKSPAKRQASRSKPESNATDDDAPLKRRSSKRKAAPVSVEESDDEIPISQMKKSSSKTDNGESTSADEPGSKPNEPATAEKSDANHAIPPVPTPEDNDPNTPPPDSKVVENGKQHRIEKDAEKKDPKEVDEPDNIVVARGNSENDAKKDENTSKEDEEADDLFADSDDSDTEGEKVPASLRYDEKKMLIALVSCFCQLHSFISKSEDAHQVSPRTIFAKA